MRQTARDLYDRVRRHPVTRSTKRGVVYTITNKKVLQGVVTGAIFAVIQLSVQNISLSINGVLQWLSGVSPPTQTTSLLLMLGVVVLALWIDQHVEEWREWVETKTGEEAADDEPE